MQPMMFPIFSVTMNYILDISEKYKNYVSEKETEGLPEGRMRSQSYFTKMFREDQTDESLQQFSNEYKENFLNKNKEKNISDLTIEIKFKERNSWCLTWFEHYTFDFGQTDDEVLQSFENFVQQKQQENFDHKRKTGDDFDKYCLMGAEDRWRWHGAEPDGLPGNHSPAPCRCKFCKEQGIIRIAH